MTSLSSSTPASDNQTTLAETESASTDQASNDRAWMYPAVPERLPQGDTRAILAAFENDPSSLWRTLDEQGGYLVDHTPGEAECTVTFVREAREPGERVVVLLDTYTHVHRSNLAPFVFDRTPFAGGEVHAVSYVLPAALRGTVGLLIEHDLDVEQGFDRPAWRAVYGRSEALPSTRDRVKTGEAGGEATVIALPDALPQPFATGTDPKHEGRLVSGEIASDVFGFPVDVWAYEPAAEYGSAERTLVLCDGSRWVDDYPIRAILDRMHEAGKIRPTSVVMFSPRDTEGRFTMLGMSDRLVPFLRDELLPWASELVVVAERPEHRAIAGASLGGLAVADVLRTAPDVIANGIVQSASMWWPMDDPEVPEGLQLRLWAEHEPDARVRVFQEVGLHEGDMVDLNRQFRDVARDRGVDIAYREFLGGHDYSNWRGGIADGLTHFFPSEQASAEADEPAHADSGEQAAEDVTADARESKRAEGN